VPTHTLHGPFTDMPLSRGGTYFAGNHLGSISVLYEPFGELATWPQASNPYQYTGRENDGTGRNADGSRSYSLLQRW
jgi:hypothetical protein